jgi:hypothetical protein
MRTNGLNYLATEQRASGRTVSSAVRPESIRYVACKPQVHPCWIDRHVIFHVKALTEFLLHVKQERGPGRRTTRGLCHLAFGHTPRDVAKRPEIRFRSCQLTKRSRGRERHAVDAFGGLDAQARQCRERRAGRRRASLLRPTDTGAVASYVDQLNVNTVFLKEWSDAIKHDSYSFTCGGHRPPR